MGKLVVFAILLTAVVHSAFGITFSGFTFAHPEFAYWASHLKWDSTTGLTCAAVCDILIAVAMVYFLSVRRTAFAKSRGLVNKLMLYSVESGALTSVCALAAMVTFLVRSFWILVASFKLTHTPTDSSEPCVAWSSSVPAEMCVSPLSHVIR
jgi:hypothetical protein